MSYEQAKRAFIRGERCEGEWLIIGLDVTTVIGEVRPCMLEDDDLPFVTSGPSVSEDKTQFWGVYRNNPDGTQQHVLDAVTKEEAVQVLQIMESFEAHNGTHQ